MRWIEGETSEGLSEKARIDEKVIHLVRGVLTSTSRAVMGEAGNDGGSYQLATVFIRIDCFPTYDNINSE